MNQKNAWKQVFTKIFLIFLYGITLLILSLPYLYWSLDIKAYVNLLKIVILFGIGSVAAVVAVGIIRKKSIINITIAKRVFSVLYCLIFIFTAVFGSLVVWGYNTETTDKFSLQTRFFSDKAILVLVPHQDDDVNLMGGIIEQYVDDGSRVHVAFSTNGDYSDDPEKRYHAAVSMLTGLGLAKEDIYFLGYGDQWQSQQQNEKEIAHIYNSKDPDVLWTSYHGRTQTYGTSVSNCYMECDYTRQNYLNSVKNLILDIQPEIIYAVDYDNHVDHKALDLFFEEAMGQILAEHPDYHPTVYKGFCYGTSWEASDDFDDSVNPLSTKKPETHVWDITVSGYSWENRMRLPMGKDNLNRMLSNNSVHQALDAYFTQNAYKRSSRVLNGDKVFWERRTDSLLYTATFSVGSDQVSIWNDFKLKDSFDISQKAAPTDGVMGASWIDVDLHQPTEINCVGLYDDPNMERNILEGYILFDDGTRVPFGPLNPDGTVTYVDFPKKYTKDFSIHVTAQDGTGGFTEIEAYSGDTDADREPELLMAVDSSDNFAYDYWIESGTSAEFSLYTFPADKAIGWDDVKWEFQGDSDCICRVDNGKLLVTCPEGSGVDITVAYGELVTTFSVSTPHRITLETTKLLQTINHRFTYASRALTLKLSRFINDHF